jgi:hypothetical protein
MLKLINYQYENFIVNGYRKDQFGWPLSFEDGRYAGVMELGVPKEEKKRIYLLPKKTEDDKFVLIAPYLAMVNSEIKQKRATLSSLLSFQ